VALDQARGAAMQAFRYCRFAALVILQCVRWYSKYAISYRHLAEMMAERGVAVDPSTIWRWVQRYAPQEIRWYQVAVPGDRLRWSHLRLYADRPPQQQGCPAFFFGKTLKLRRDWPPLSIITDKSAGLRRSAP
jgi:transposase, IS6 family